MKMSKKVIHKHRIRGKKMNEEKRRSLNYRSRWAEAVRVRPATLFELTIQDVEDFYWEAMQAVGWPTSKAKSQKAGSIFMRGYEYLYYEANGFTFIDAWSTPHTDGNSEGKTTICFMDVPVWVMNYGGQYPKEAIPFLKLALIETIKEKTFIGGRGPSDFKDEKYPDFFYFNICAYNKFNKFSGREVVTNKKNPHTSIGYHEYWGMSLI